MKKKILTFVLGCLLSIPCMFLTACGGGNPPASDCKHTNTSYTEATTGNCTTKSTIEYWKCNKCNKYFSDQEYTAEITLDDIYLDYVHSYEYKFNDTTHWQDCENCDATTTPVNHTMQNDECTENCGYALHTVGLSYQLNNDETGYILTGNNNVLAENIIIPSTYNGKPVVKIASTFHVYLRDVMKTVVIPNSITEWDSVTFNGCSALEKITISEGIEEIGAAMCMNCDNLKTIEFPSTLKKIGGSAFHGCKGLETIVLPEGLQEIDGYAFYDCESLKTIKIPNSVTIMQDYVFDSCTDLEKVELSSGLEAVPYLCTPGCTDMNLKELIIKKGTISSSYFEGITSLTKLTLGSGVSYIYQGALKNLTALQELTIPFIGSSPNATTASAETLFGFIFGTESSTGVETNQFYANPNTSTSVRYYIPATLKKVTVLNGPILFGAFYNCINLEEINLPSTIPANATAETSQIDYYAFYNCKKITSIKIPEGTTRIGGYAFYGCELLNNVIIPEGVLVIGTSSFMYCDSLTNIVIPVSITHIDQEAFSTVGHKLTTIYYGGTADEWSDITIATPSIGFDKYELENAKKYYYSATAPTTVGDYWRFVDGVVAIWE